jgi:putative restriction endonuclease
MAVRVRWKRDELLIVLSLYHKLRFGQFDHRQPVIGCVAEKLGRTPSSVAMKLCNLASLDTVLKLRGIDGLKGASRLDREMWNEYHGQPAEMVPLAQERFDALFVQADIETTEVISGVGVFRAAKTTVNGTEALGITKQRRGQGYFRDCVLNNYDNCCALTGLPIRELLVASHILPWAGHETHRLDVRNGIALNRLHDAAFDQGLIGFDDELRLVLSIRLKKLLPQQALSVSFEAYERHLLHLSADAIPPDLGFLAQHRIKFDLS